MKMPVIKEKEGKKTKLEFIDLKDILYFTVNKSRIIVQTAEGTYTLPSSLEDCAMIAGFEKLDRPYVVQMEKVADIDEQYNIVYFDSEKKLRCTVASSKVVRTKKMLNNLSIPYWRHASALSDAD